MKPGAHRAYSALFIAALILVGMATPPAIAHHSYAMYDTAVRKTVTGKLVRFVLGGNHSQFIMEALNPDGSPILDKGKPAAWTIETASSAQLAGRNITVESFKIHTIFTITFSPLRDGRSGGAQQGAGLIMCGMTMPAGGCTEATGKRY